MCMYIYIYIYVCIYRHIYRIVAIVYFSYQKRRGCPWPTLDISLTEPVEDDYGPPQLVHT